MLKAPICIILIDPHNNPVVNKSIVISTFQMRKSRLREVGSQRSHNQEVANLGSEKKAASFKAHDPQHQGRLDFERRNWKNKTLLFLSRWLLPWNHGNIPWRGPLDMKDVGYQPQSMCYSLWSASWGTGSLPEHKLLTVVSFLRHRKALFQCVSTVPSVASEDYHRGPVQSLLQNRRSLPPVAEDWNLSHGVRFYWDSFLVTPHNSTVGR